VAQNIGSWRLKTPRTLYFDRASRSPGIRETRHQQLENCMITRGAYGFRHNSIDKVTYNHCDSYPSWLGKLVIEFIKRNNLKGLKRIEQGIRLVDKHSDPSDEDIKKYDAFCNIDVGGPGAIISWYRLLRDAQGDFEAFENGLDVMIDSANFLKDSLFCEWAYIVNLDDSVLEIYKGFNTSEYAAGRYAKVVHEEPYDFQGVKLFKTIPFNEIWLVQHMDIFLTKLFSEINEMAEIK
jgi:hypothetical protein